MTSSNGTDWFPPAVSPSEHGCTRLHITVPNELIENIDELAKADFSNRSAAVSKCIAFYVQSHSQQEASLISGYTSGVSVRAGGGGSNQSVTTDQVPLQHFDHQQHFAEKAVSPLLNSLKPKECLGEESEDTLVNELLTPKEKGTNPRATCTSKRTKNDPYARKTLKPADIPDDLKHLEELLIEFWSVKKGTRSKTRWNRLTSKLRKWSDEEQKQALIAACNSGWGDVFERQPMASPGSNRFKPEEPKHPASQVFRASDQHWPSVGSNW